MNEEALKDAYNLFVQQGYNKSIDDFKQLIASNPDALKDSYNLFAQQGYTKSIDDYKTLIGVSDVLKKKEEPILPMAPQKEQVPSAIPGMQPFTGSPLAGTPSELPSSISEEQPETPVAPVTPSYVEPTPVQPEQGPLGAFNQKITGPDYGGQLTPAEQALAVKIIPPVTPIKEEIPKEEKQGYFSQLVDQGILGINQLDKMIASIPEAAYNILAIPQNLIAYTTGLDIATSADKLGKDLGIENPILKQLNKEEENLSKKINKFNVENYQKTGIYENIKDGNYADAFQLLGSGITQSVPVSLAMMLGGATLSAAELTAAGTLTFSEGSREQLNQTAPDMPEIEKTIKSLGMAAAETVFSEIGTGTIGQVYKDIIKKEGVEAGKVVFKNGLVEMYKSALKKYGAPIGLLGEGIEEAATQITQNVISGRPAFDGAADAFITGGGSGVVFASPITAYNAGQNIKNIVQTNKSKSEINTILKDKPSELHQIFNVPQAEPFTPEQIQIANTNKSRDILVKNLEKNVKNGTITQDDAKQSIYIFDKAQQVSNAVKDLDISSEKKTEVANLLSKRNELKTKIENKEDVLVVKEKQQIDQINKQISDIILEPKSEENAIQEQAANESVLRTGQPTVGLQKVVKGNVQPEVTTTGTQEVVNPKGGTQEVVKTNKLPEGVTIEEAVTEDGEIDYEAEDELRKIAKDRNLGITSDRQVAYVAKDSDGNIVGGAFTSYDGDKYTFDVVVTKDQEGTGIGSKLLDAVSKIPFDIKDQNPNATVEVDVVNPVMQKMLEARGFEVKQTLGEGRVLMQPIVSSKTQEVTPAEVIPIVEVEQYVPITDKEVSHEAFTKDNAIDYEEDYKTGDNGREYSYISSLTVELTDNDGNSIGNLIKLVDEDGNMNFEAKDVDGNKLSKDEFGFDTKGEAKKALVDKWNKTQKKEFDKEAKKKVKEAEKAAQKQAKKTTKKQVNEQPTVTPTPEPGPIAGNRLFNKPLKKVAEIADRYYKRIFGTDRPKYYGSRGLDEARAKRIADAYEKMKHNPNDPEVKAAYEALAKETLDQYKDFLDAGFTVEINDDEPYDNSQDMINDLRDNNRIKIFSTESGFGDNKITKKQRAENSLLKKSGYKDINGKPLLINDVFRAIHDFFGHAELGNSFGAKGEENAWNVHSRMYFPLARKAMTTETRGQNSFVNFSGVNEEVNKLREKARKLRQEGDIEGAKAIVKKIYKEGSFAEQKIGLLPEEFSEIEVTDTGDVNLQPQGLETREVSAEEQGIADELMNLDVNDEDSLKRILDALDRVDENISKKLFGRANESLLAIPLGTVQLVIKSLKALVKGGMLLRDAIRKVATDNNISQESIKDILNIAPIQEGFNSVMSKVDAMIERQKRRGVEEKRIISNVDTLVRNEEVYKNADDAQKKILEREARVKLGAKARRAPSIGRVLGVLKGIANVSREDKLKVIKEIRELSRDAAKDLAKEIRSLGADGTITVNQAANIVAKFGKVNMLSEISVSNFVDYISNVFKDAEYQSKLNTANNLKSSIKKLSKNADKNANLRVLGEKFFEIDPSMVEDIDSYNEMASKINEAILGSTIKKQKVNFAETVNIENASKYIEKTLDAQDKIIAEKRISEIQNLMGIDASEFSAEQMLDLLKGDESITKYNEGVVRDTINKAFQVYSAIIKNIIKTGKDAFTGEDIEFTKSEKELVGKFMDMDLNVLSPKDALKAVDALTNFLQNHSIAKMDAVVSQYTALVNGDKLVQKGVKARELTKYWSSQAGRFLAEQTTTLPVLFEKMFPGFNRSGYVMDMIGLTKLISKTSYAKNQAKNIVNDYIGKFYKKEANGEAFNTAYNNIERGMAAKLIRTVIGTEAEMQKEFDRRKELIEQSIEDLSNGDDKEQAMADLYQQAYDKLVAPSKSVNQNQKTFDEATNIQEIRDRVDKTNLEAIDFWIENWSNKYEQFAQVSEGVYNILLEKDLNYTPDKLSLLSSYSEDVELNNEESAFHKNSGELYDRESGVLIKTTKPNAKDIKKASRYLDLSFDKNMSNSMYDALIDVNTAAPIKQINAFLNSPNFDKIFPNKKDAVIIKGNKKNIGRLQLYVNNIRGKNHFTDDELSSVMRKFDKMAAIGVGQALGTLSQPFKQVIPIAVNTLINSGSLPDIGAITNIDKFNFISNSGEAIANRGAQSQFEIESINKLITEASTSTGSKALELIEKANAKLIDYLLVKPDVAIARASWLSYYEQSLKQQGVDVNVLDYSKHEKNDEAANFAQRQVDRQQNVSDHDLSGKLFSTKDTSTKILVKTLMSFASFRMNSSSRVGADLTTLNDKTSTAEDRLIAAKSLAGYGAELATFKIVSLVATVLIGSLTKMIMGDDEDEEEYNKRVEKAIKSQRSSIFSDIFSPLPIADPFIQQYVAKPLLDKVEEFSGAPVSIYGSSHKETLFSTLGSFGIAFDRASKIIDLGKLAATGKYTDDFGKEHTISESKRESLKPFVPLTVLASIGVIPQEGNTLAMNSMRYAKAKSSTPQEKIDAKEKTIQKEELISEKVDALEKVRTRTRNQAEADAIDKKISELEADTEDKKVIKEANAEEKLQKKELLTNPVTGKKYDNESELKRYNPRLYNKNFGIRSQWYKEHKAEKTIEKKINAEIRKIEDKENRYSAPAKRKNLDGSFKRSSYRKYSSSRSSQ